MYLVVGLGNPGGNYAKTRHNIGFMTLDLLAKKLGIKISKKCCSALIGEGKCGEEKVILAKPQTFMNLSGEAVSSLKKKFKISLENIIVFSDDIDLEIGAFRHRLSGSAGTHNGLRNIIACLNADNFQRLRIGIGKPIKEDLAQYVLSSIDSSSQNIINEVMDKATDKAIEIICHANN